MPEVRLMINQQPYHLLVETGETLLDTLRDRLHLAGTKRGCDTGDCGSCTVLLNGKPVNACLLLTLEADNAAITTIEGIRHPLQEKFVQCGAFQCGYCAPGVVASSVALLERNPHPKSAEVKKALTGHLCRCTGYVRMLQALTGKEEILEPSNPEFSVVGKPVIRKDGQDKATGNAKFTADIYFPGMVYGALVKSPHPSAKIVKIHTALAQQIPGVLLILTGNDVPQTPYGVSPSRYDETILPLAVVRHVGETVAAVFATEPRIAARAAEAVAVEYEVLSPVCDPMAAQQESAAQLHSDYPKNINTEIHQDFGQIEEVFQTAPYVRDDVFTGQRTHQAYLEPPAALCMEEGDLVNLWTANQTPHHVQYHIARVLDIPMSKLRVIKPAMGGGFGGKAETTKLDFLAVIAARRLRRPVLMVMDRKEVFYHHRGRHAQTIHLKTAFSKAGKILGSHIHVTLDGGAYTSYGIITSYYTGSLIPTPYLLPNFRFDSYRIYTNLPACGAQRGNGTPQPRFAFESQLDMAAKDLGISPLAIRAQNLIESGHKTINDLQITSCGIKECLAKVAEMSNFTEKHQSFPFGMGIGLGLGCFISGAGYPIIRGDLPHSSALIRVGEDGQRVFVYTGAPEIGQGSDTVLCQIAAEALGISYDRMTILSADTAVAPTDLGAYASRVTFMAGNAVLSAAQDVCAQLAAYFRQINGITQGMTPGEVKFREGKISCGNQVISFQELAEKFYHEKGVLAGRGSYNPPKLGGKFKGAAVGTSPAYSFCAVAAEVNVDLETGQVRVDHMYAAHDSGTIINPVTFNGQVEGALVMGVGEALMEKIEHNQGQLRNPNFHDYLLPTIMDAPEIHCASVPIRDPNGPFGAKEVGEGTILPVMGAIANAVEHAVGARITSLPITAGKVYRAMKEQAR